MKNSHVDAKRYLRQRRSSNILLLIVLLLAYHALQPDHSAAYKTCNGERRTEAANIFDPDIIHGNVQIPLRQPPQADPDAASWLSAVGNAPPPQAAGTRRLYTFNLDLPTPDVNPQQAYSDHSASKARQWLDIHESPAEGLSLLALMIAIAAATLISEDLACIGAGLLAARGGLSLPLAVIASFGGIVFGDMLLFLAGKHLGRPALKYPPLKWVIKDDDVTRSSRWFNAKGPVIIITSRFIPGSRLPTYFSAGILDTGFWQFTLYFCIAAALWTPLLVGLAAVIGERMFDYYDLFSRYSILILVGTVLLLWLLIKLIIPLFSYRGRRMLLSSYRRKTRWEFWPPYVFYIPIVVYNLYLGLRFGSLTLFTAANPAIPEGGFIGESKSRILDNLSQSASFVARYRLIEGGARLDARLQKAVDFMHAIDAGFPVVVKPDVGERGAGVTIVSSEKELLNCLNNNAQNLIVQEYIDGHEYGVFYYRYPGEQTGRIFSITDKRLLRLTGDGKSTLETLILADERAVCMARFHLRHHKDRLYQVPAQGEEIHLVQVGTHCRGALFLDGEPVRTAALEAAIDKISKGFSGFYFGRYDIRVPSLADFKEGKGFKIVELNGVTSEATHIYNPGNSLWYAYRILMRQWRMAFEIGAINRRRGIRPADLGQLLKNLRH